MYAARYGNADAVSRLIEAGAKLDATNIQSEVGRRSEGYNDVIARASFSCNMQSLSLTSCLSHVSSTMKIESTMLRRKATLHSSV